MNEGIIEIKDRLAKVMQPLLAQLRTVLPGANPVKLHPFRCQGTMSDIRKNGARAMGYLLESSPNMCYGYLKTIASGTTVGNKKLQKDPNFISLLKYMETQQANGFPLHPKMETLRTLLVNHFAQHMSDREDAEERKTQDILHERCPLIRATRFIGQGTDGQGKKGLLQKDQLQTIDRFKAGEFNVLVATSIGEEGLDIGEVDVAICYEAQKTPIRMLQRIGRTGRKRDGYVHSCSSKKGRKEIGNERRINKKTLGHSSCVPKILNYMETWSDFYLTISNRNASRW
ncbi:ATP-dependent DNA helicase mph1 [Grifola frondosa]|uniref:ATP-dependent DNA helicase n=1 Tax=Grifola frondosa TaxID=5627 RepID=A0A1C7MV64_GRIFR|nr:ATP-dependent DNA helicase mph1 [Grifola frondosa]